MHCNPGIKLYVAEGITVLVQGGNQRTKTVYCHNIFAWQYKQ